MELHPRISFEMNTIGNGTARINKKFPNMIRSSHLIKVINNRNHLRRFEFKYLSAN